MNFEHKYRNKAVSTSQKRDTALLMKKLENQKTRKLENQETRKPGIPGDTAVTARKKKGAAHVAIVPRGQPVKEGGDLLSRIALQYHRRGRA